MADVPEPLPKLDRGVSTGGASDSEGTLVHAVRHNDMRHVRHLVDLNDHPVTPAAIAAARAAGNREMLDFLTGRFDPYGDGRTGAEANEGYGFSRPEVEALAEVETPIEDGSDDDFEAMQQNQAEVDRQLREAAALEAEDAREKSRRDLAATVLGCVVSADEAGLKAALYSDHGFDPSELVSRQAYDAAQRCGDEVILAIVHAHFSPYDAGESGGLVGAFTAEEAEEADVVGEGEDFADELEQDRRVMAEAEAEEENTAAGRAAAAVAEAVVSDD